MLRAEVGEVLRAGRLELARRADLVGRVAGHHLVDRGRVVEQPVRRVAHRADHRELVGDLRRACGRISVTWMPGILVAIGLNDAADVVRHVFLGVPQVEMARAALEVDHDDALGLAPAGTAAGLGAPGRRRLELEHRAQAQTQQARAPDPQDVAPRDPQLRIAQVFPSLSGYDDHRRRSLVSHVGPVQSVRATSPRMSNKYCIERDRPCPAESDLFPKTGDWCRSTRPISGASSRRRPGDRGRRRGASAAPTGLVATVPLSVNSAPGGHCRTAKVCP